MTDLIDREEFLKQLGKIAKAYQHLKTDYSKGIFRGMNDALDLCEEIPSQSLSDEITEKMEKVGSEKLSQDICDNILIDCNDEIQIFNLEGIVVNVFKAMEEAREPIEEKPIHPVSDKIKNKLVYKSPEIEGMKEAVKNFCSKNPIIK